MSAALNEIMKQADQLSLTERLELIVYIAQRSQVLESSRKGARQWNEIAGLSNRQIFGEDAQAYISRMREESDHIRLEGLRSFTETSHLARSC